MVTRPTPPAVGDRAPALALPTVEGVPFDLRSWSHRPVLVSFLRHAG